MLSLRILSRLKTTFFQLHHTTATLDIDDDDVDALIRQNAANAGVECSSRETARNRKRARAGPLLLLLPLGRGGHGSFHLVLALATTFVTAQVGE